MSAKTKTTATKAPAAIKPKRTPSAPKAEVAPEVIAEPVIEVAAIPAEAIEPEPVAVEIVEVETPVAEAPFVELEAPVAEVAAPAAEIEITPPTATPPLKEKPMTTIPSFDFSVFQTAFSDIQTKAKAAIEKSTAAFGDYNAIAKGNVEALVEAGKILTAGLQELGTGAVAESRTAFETLTTEVKELASTKSPTEFLRLQSELAKKHIDHAVAVASKQSEAVLKLSSDVAAPVSNRVAVTVSKLQKVA